MWDKLQDPTIIAAFIALAGAGWGAWQSAKLQKFLKNEDTAEKSLSAQLQGWKNLVSQLQDEVKSLRVYSEALEGRIKACEDDRRALHLELQRFKRTQGDK